MKIFSRLKIEDFEEIIFINSNRANLRAILVIHDTTLGPAFGGIRLRRYSNEEEAFLDAMRLARAMTYKCAVSSVPGGGAKMVVLEEEGFDRELAFLSLGKVVQNLGGRYRCGRDMGTTQRDMELLRTQTEYVVDESEKGCGDLNMATALGVLEGMKGCLGFSRGDSSLKGVRVALQGIGAVGAILAQMLAAEGAKIYATDLDERLLREKASSIPLEPVLPEEIFDLQCDIFSPCAVGGVLNSHTIPRLRCKIVAGCANNQLEDPKDAVMLHQRGILYAPDYVINAGACIQGALWSLTRRKDNLGKVRAIKKTLEEIFKISREEDLPPSSVADRLVQQRLGKDKDYLQLYW